MPIRASAAARSRFLEQLPLRLLPRLARDPLARLGLYPGPRLRFQAPVRPGGVVHLGRIARLGGADDRGMRHIRGVDHHDRIRGAVPLATPVMLPATAQLVLLRHLELLSPSQPRIGFAHGCTHRGRYREPSRL
ncbi:MAG: hypothetical protein D3X82_15020 [Candidatus Leucobacter sulfamidivorax]|nr:hypothetical protein [Candidatus Leucobacter sulfamidivorax]